MKYFEKIKGERIYLSPVSKEDIEQYTQWVNDISISDRLGISSQVYTVEREQEILNDMSKNGCNFAIILREDNRLIGNCSLQNINHISQCSEIGLFIGDEANRSKGYGAEALKLLVDFGFNTLNLRNIMLRVFSFNKNAIACYEKVGFKKIGARRQACFINGKFCDDVFMDIIRSDY